MDSFKKVLMDVPVDNIDRNPENPRLYFRQQELDELTDSIRRHGVQVPIAVYRDGNRYVLIDGERRWRCSLKLNKKTIPALVQEKPDPLNNLVLMFNIHALREQWDLLTIALKLPRVIELYESKNGELPKERQLSEETGLSRSVIRRCKLLMSLPEHHLDNIKNELKKPKSQQKISEDFYIEMEKALVTVSRSMPDIIPDEQVKENARQTLLYKYSNGIIKNLVDLRKIGKIARAGNVKADVGLAKSEMYKLLNVTEYTIEQAFQSSVSEAYLERDISTTVESLLEELSVI
jgi:ParB/RepB/Spo0J family partition protein